MNAFAELFLFRMGMASVFLAGGAVIAWCALNAFRCQSAFVHRTTWCLVLAQSLLVFQFPIAIPWEHKEPSGEATGNVVVNSDSLIALDSFATNQTIPNAEVKHQVTQLIPNLHWSTILLTIWTVGVLVVLCQWSTRYVWFICYLQIQKCEHKQWNQDWADLLSEKGIVSHIPLYVSRSVGPLLCRWPNGQRVIVPESLWSRLPREQRQAILRHELAHFERHDLLKSLLANLVAATHWFNPLAWFAVRQFENAIEWTCDRIVQATKPDAKLHYAKALLALGSSSPTSTTWASAIFGGGLAGRIRRIISSEDRSDPRFKVLIPLGLLVGLSAVHVLRVDLVAQDASLQTNDIIKEGYFIAPVVTDLQKWQLKGHRLTENKHISVYANVNGRLFFNSEQPMLDMNRFDFVSFFSDLKRIPNGSDKGVVAIYIDFASTNDSKATNELADKVEATFQRRSEEAGIKNVKFVKHFTHDDRPWKQLEAETSASPKEPQLGNKSASVFPISTALSRFLVSRSPSGKLRCLIDIATVQPPSAAEALSAEDKAAIRDAVAGLNLPKGSSVELVVHFEKPQDFDKLREQVPQTNKNSEFQREAVNFLKSLGFEQVGMNVEVSSVSFRSTH